MSLTFAKNSAQLVNWGFSVGDIATLAGAGRDVITWVTASARDRNLLEFLNVAEKELKFRKGLIDPSALNQRWSKEITLFKDGKKEKFSAEGPRQELENMDRFTWVMTLIVVCLDVAVSSSLLQSVVVDFSSALFEDSILEPEYLQLEIPTHIKGWRSSAAIRRMPKRAQAIWDDLEGRETHHLPGNVPENEKEHLVRFLLWLVTGSAQIFITNSSDIHSLAVLLGDMGFDHLKTGEKNSLFDERFHVLVFDPSTIQESEQHRILANESRRGMRVPLGHMEEVVSLWPAGRGNPGLEAHNKLRSIFEAGSEAAATLEFSACSSPWGNRDSGLAFRVTASDDKHLPRADKLVYRLVESFLLHETASAVRAFEQIVLAWPPRGLDFVVNQMAMLNLVVGPSELSFHGVETGIRQVFGRSEQSQCRIELRTFLLGYFYTSLRKITDVSQLDISEAFGSWGWYDSGFYRRIRNLVKVRIKDGSEPPLYWRYQLMKMVAYLFAGAEDHQLDSLKPESAGLLAKLSVVTPGLLGAADTPERLSKFHLIDVDSTVFPSNGSGVIFLSAQKKPQRRQLEMSESLSLASTLPVQNPSVDFTSHIEPAWGIDSNLCQVTFRYRGRLIHQVNSLESEASVMEWWYPKASDTSASDTTETIEHVKSLSLQAFGRGSSSRQNASGSCIYTVKPSDFEGGRITVPYPYRHLDVTYSTNASDSKRPTSVLLVSSRDLPKARTCLAAMYAEEFAGKRTEMKDYPWKQCSPESIVMQLSESDRLVVLL